MHHLLFVEQDYAFSILAPIARAAKTRGDDVTWYVLPGKNSEHLEGEKVVRRLKDAQAVSSDSVIVPGNWIPSGLSGLVVQVFHGFGIEKKGHFRIRGFFDLYCTPGPRPTKWFSKQAETLGYFQVIETGWSKLDPNASEAQKPHVPSRPLKILFAPTFSPTLTAAPDLLPEWEKLLTTSDYDITIRFHPLMDEKTVAEYRALMDHGLAFDESSSVMETIAANDIVVSDTSSIVHEALWHNRPVVTFRNMAPDKHVVDFTDPTDLADSIAKVADQYTARVEAAATYVGDLHPYWDGQSSERILDAIVQAKCAPTSKKKPSNWLRRWRIIRKVRRMEKEIA